MTKTTNPSNPGNHTVQRKPANTTQRSAHLNTLGEGLSVARDAIKTLMPNRSVPSSVWDNARLDDIGNNYEIIREAPVLDEYRFNNPFLRGRSDFIFYEVRSAFTKPEKKAVVTPLNLNNKLSKPQRRKIARRIGENIEDFTTFFLEEILPISLAIPSAGQKVDELMLQLLDDKANLPMKFIQDKATMAVYLRIIRHMAGKFKLTKSEQKMMFREYSNASIFKI